MELHTTQLLNMNEEIIQCLITNDEIQKDLIRNYTHPIKCSNYK